MAEIKDYTEKFGRRELFSRFIGALTTGAIAGGITYMGADYAFSNIGDALEFAEKELRETKLDLETLSGNVERNLKEQREIFQSDYEEGSLDEYVALGITDANEVKEFEYILNNLDKLEDEYNIRERLQIYKDRVDTRILALDSSIDEHKPGAVRRIDNGIRRIFGQRSGTEGDAYRGAIKNRLGILCDIYDTNEDNRVAQTKVMEKINEYLENTGKMTYEERGMLRFLQQQYQKESDGETLRQFITNYDKFAGTDQTLLRIRGYLDDLESTYDLISSNKDRMLSLQDLLDRTLVVKREARDTFARAYEGYEQEVEMIRPILDDLDPLKTALYASIDDFNTQYPDDKIITRDAYINSTPLTNALRGKFDWVKLGAAGVMGALFSILSWKDGRLLSKKKVLQQGLGAAVDDVNDLTSRNAGLEGMVTNLRDNNEALEQQNGEYRAQLGIEEPDKYAPKTPQWDEPDNK